MTANKVKSFPCLRNPESVSSSAAIETNRGGKTRGWTPLKYPRSVFFSDENERSITPFFPYHHDILCAVIRELLILEARIDRRSLRMRNKVPTEANTQEVTSDSHSSASTWNTGCLSKRKCTIQEPEMNKRARIPVCCEGTTSGFREVVHVDTDVSLTSRSVSAEGLVSIILDSLLLGPQSGSSLSVNVHPSPRMSVISTAVVTRPRKVSEVDQMTQVPISNRVASPDDISCYLDLSEHDESGAFVLFNQMEENVPPMVHVSISDEAHLRDTAMEMTKRLVHHFHNRTLGLFFGYKSSSANYTRISQLLSSFLFDTSHAMFAWIQTEQDFLAQHGQTENLDMDIQASLFDHRAIYKIGGLKPHCILPQALSIRRLRKRNISWEKFATTAQYQRMLGHLSKEKSVVAAGKERRGQRLRQRHWLTSNLLVHDIDESHTTSSSRSRSSSLGSETDIIDAQASRDALSSSCMARQSRILSDVAGSKAISLIRKNILQSWGVGLLQEGCACIVGKAQFQAHGDSEERGSLCCGDMVLYVHNERGEYASPPICSWYKPHNSDEEWFQNMVSIFRTSIELHLVIQRA